MSDQQKQDAAVQRCREEQRRAARHILDGGGDERGARQGMSDWFAEELIREGLL